LQCFWQTPRLGWRVISGNKSSCARRDVIFSWIAWSTKGICACFHKITQGTKHLLCYKLIQ
jgi:hypothetical protein